MSVAGERRPGCDGCGRQIALERLTTVTMPSGERVACCPACEPHARNAARTSDAPDNRRGTCDGCAGTFRRRELEELVLDDGTVVTCCPSCTAEAPGRANGDDAESADERDGTRNRCSQCTERVAEELFLTTTIDDRTERLCSSCKADAEDRGILKRVAMRRERAREILGVEAGASADEVRTAFHEQVKRAHPDRESGSKAAFGLVTDAYDRLRNDDH
ncbi:J domain-containing protein [Natronococcus wangiae]|uniref:J domain-containing protein n=1 Tax=Natronococcus wangiae TaxID=3068275 RepID=UPI00273F4F78|nr:J domain-containing protein [Natronococcus sp. AD5]